MPTRARDRLGLGLRARARWFRAAVPAAKPAPSSMRVCLGICLVYHLTGCSDSSTTAGNISIFATYGGSDDAVGLKAAGVNTIIGGPVKNPKVAGGYNFSEIRATHTALGISTFVDISGELWVGRSGLKPGWEAAVTDVVAAAAASGALSSGAVTGLFLGDEICCDGVAVSNLSAAASFSKAALRKVGHGQAYVYVNECKNAFIGR